MDGILSQEEISALLNDTGSENATQNTSLTDNEKDAIGEIANISMGTAATTLFSLVNRKVEISTPVVSLATWDDIVEAYERPCVFIRIAYTVGLDGNNLLILKENDVKIITDLMMGGDGTNTDGELGELHLSAICEAMNQMMGSAATSLSSMLNKTIDISPPHADLIDLQENVDEGTIDEFLKNPFVKISFKMEIGDLVNSTIMQLYPISFAKEMCASITQNMEQDAAANASVTPQPKAKPEPQPTPEELLWRARDAKRQEIYDKDIHHYYIDEQDAYVSNTLQVKDKCGRQEEVEVGGHLYASNILTVALDEIADYSEQCGRVTDDLLSRIDAAQTAEEVEAIVVKGYPEMIHTTTAALQTKADKAIAKSPEAQAVTFARAMMNSVSLTASQALEMQVLFPIWGEKDAEFGKEVEIGFRLRVVEGENDTLFEVIQKHKLQADWKPGIETASLYKIVEAEHAGTLDDPIPYVQGMAFEKDKYYEQYGVIYLCILTTVTGYPNDLKDLPTIVQEVKQ